MFFNCLKVRKKIRTEEKILKDFEELGYKHFEAHTIIKFYKTLETGESVNIEVIFASKEVTSWLQEPINIYRKKEVRLMTFKEIELIKELIDCRRKK